MEVPRAEIALRVNYNILLDGLMYKDIHAHLYRDELITFRQKDSIDSKACQGNAKQMDEVLKILIRGDLENQFSKFLNIMNEAGFDNLQKTMMTSYCSATVPPQCSKLYSCHYYALGSGRVRILTSFFPGGTSPKLLVAVQHTIQNWTQSDLRFCENDGSKRSNIND